LEHKAFVFDWDGFHRELSSILSASLDDGSPDVLRSFVNTNIALLRDPYEGESLDASWESMIEHPDPHQYGDVALTKYYDPQQDIGLGFDWEKIQGMLARELGGNAALLLGTPFGPSGNFFDPGKQGSYFQSPSMVKENIGIVRKLRSRAHLLDVLPAVEAMFRSSEVSEKGLYVTF